MDKSIKPEKKITEIMKEENISAKKRFGQNFLADKGVLKKIIEGSGAGKDDNILEIGPGLGTLTEELAKRAGKVVAVEIDKDLIPVLSEMFGEYENVDIINGDILKINIAGLFKGKFKVVANLPYYITTPVIMKLLEGGYDIESITVMVQKEVEERMNALPGGKDYGALSLAVQYRGKVSSVANVPANCFVPRPNVDSAVVRIDIYEKKPVIPEDENEMFEIIRAAFAQRRKTLCNALYSYDAAKYPKEKTAGILRKMGLDGNIRGERLSLSEFAVFQGKCCGREGKKG